MDLSLSGKRAIVCGSTQGIGRASAIALARLGATITLIARDEEALRRTADALTTDSGQDHDWIIADFSDPVAVGHAASNAASEGRPCHVLVNNSGGPPAGRAIDATEDAYLAAFRSHVLASQILARAVVPSMRDAGYGRIINIISTSVRQPIPGLGVSNTIRGAMASWSKTLSMELAAFGITVNNVLPGFTETARLMSLIRSRAQARNVSEDAVAREMRDSVPMGRFGSAEEVANAVAFLASPAAGYISGQSLAVDGARTSAL